MTYAKALAALLGALGTWGVTASDGGITLSEWFGLTLALGTALGVYAVPNRPPEAVPNNVHWAPGWSSGPAVRRPRDGGSADVPLIVLIAVGIVLGAVLLALLQLLGLDLTPD